LDTGALYLSCADKHWIDAKGLLILAPGGLVLNQPSDMWTERETLTARCCSGKAKHTTFNCLCTQLPFYS